MTERYSWPEGLTERGSKWSDYTYRGRWTHSCLWAKDGTMIASMYPRYAREWDHIPQSVVWDTEFGDEGEEVDRRSAKREARVSCRLFLEG